MSRKTAIHLFGFYSFVTSLGYLLLNMMPPFVRKVIFKCILCQFGKESFIDYKTYIRYPRKVRIGDNVTINRECSFFASHMIKDAYIELGNNVMIAPKVVFLSAGHDYSKLDFPDIASSIIVEDYVWIGARSIILPGVRIGKGAVVGAGSVVTRDIPAWSVAVGNPAKVIKNRCHDSCDFG